MNVRVYKSELYNTYFCDPEAFLSGVNIEMPEAQLEWINQTMRDFWDVQTFLRNQYAKAIHAE